MTVQTTDNLVIYTGDGATVTFPFTFAVLVTSDMKVYLDKVLQISGYTVTLQVVGGNVAFDTPPAQDVEVLLAREVPLTQQTDYVEYDPFQAETHEDALDKLTMIDQQQQEELDRTLKSEPGTTVPTLNLGDNPEGKVLEVNSTGTEINAVTSATDLLNAEINAEASATAAASSASSAATSEGYAHQWAVNPEDNLVNDGTNPQDYSSYHYSRKAAALVATGVELVNGEVSGSGDLLTDFNAMDWTGHHNAGTPPTTFAIASNNIAQFKYDDVLYDWFGPKGVNVGLGGDYTAVSGNLVIAVTNEAVNITFDPNNSSLVSTNVQAAIDETVNTTIPAATAGVVTGYKNVLRNPDFRINQRGFGGDWSTETIGNFGYDGWRKHSAAEISQVIEEGDFWPNVTYTLSTNEGYTQTFSAPAAGGNMTIVVPDTASWVQLELGPNSTTREVRPIALELSLCQRYYTVDLFLGASGYADASGQNAPAHCTIAFPTTMRITPDPTYTFIQGANNTSVINTIRINSRGLTSDVTSSAAGRVFWEGTVTLNAEIT